jgi:hypothetical protein
MAPHCSLTDPTDVLSFCQLVPGKTRQEAPLRLDWPYTLFMPR